MEFDPGLEAIDELEPDACVKARIECSIGVTLWTSDHRKP